MKRTTAQALGVSAALVTLAGTVATAAIFQLPVFGLGPNASATAPTSTTTPPSVVERTIYHDHFVSVPGSGGGGTSRASVRPAPVSAPAAAPPPTPPAAAPPAAVPSDDGQPGDDGGGAPGGERGD